MQTNYLLPHCFKKIGWFLFVPSFIMGLIMLPVLEGVVDISFEFFKTKVFAIAQRGFFTETSYFKIIENNILDEIVAIGIIVGGMFVAFSKERNEDEFISKIRLESLLWATYVNYIILLFAIIFVYEFGFITVMIVNMFTVLLFFLGRFYWVIYRTKKQSYREK